MIFRDLTPEEETEFRQWARQNWKPGDAISELWHPVVIDEIGKIRQEYLDRFDALGDPESR
jgi:hypothetical protein